MKAKIVIEFFLQLTSFVENIGFNKNDFSS